MMASLDATPGSQSGESSALDLPSLSDIRDYVLRRPSPEASGDLLQPIPFSSSGDPDSSDQNTEHKDSWTPENFWFDPPMKSQSEAEEDDTLRKSLDRFYELLGHPQMASGDPLSASIGQCLSQKISELRSQESQEYALRTFQMARVILTRDGCSAVQSHSRDAGFCPLEEGGEALDDAERTPGLSKDVIRFLLQQNMRKDP